MTTTSTRTRRPTVAPGNRLTDSTYQAALGRRILAEHEAIRQSDRDNLRRALRIGQWLTQGKAWAEEHGMTFRAWMATNTPGLPRQTAADYRNDYLASLQCTNLGQIGLTEYRLQRRHGEARGRASAARRRPAAFGTGGTCAWEFRLGDCASLPFPDDYFDLVFCSPPYESQRAYAELDFCLTGEAWLEWAVPCYLECLRVCKGLVAWMIEGATEDFAYSSTPFLLMADLHRRGVKVRKPVVFHRRGIPGTGGPDWLRNDWEPVICATKNGRLPWADNKAMGQAPKQDVPRKVTNRQRNGERKNLTCRDPDVSNPGNVISGLVGCGGLGWEGAHENEAPFPEWLVEFFVRSFCPPGGKVLDPFSGSGTTVAVAVCHGRQGVGIDVRESQKRLGETRLLGLTVSERAEVPAAAGPARMTGNAGSAAAGSTPRAGDGEVA